MKRILSLILAITMCLSLCFVFGSCELIKKYIPGLDNKAEEETEVVYTITQEQWDANLEENNFSAKLVVLMVASSDTETMKMSGHSTINQTATSSYTVSSMTYEYPGTSPEKNDMVEYCEQKGDSFYSITEDENGAWVGEKLDYSQSFDPIGEVVSSLGGDITYDQLVFDEEKNIYTYTSKGSIMGIEDADINYEFTFENGKIAKLALSASGEVADFGAKVTYTLNYTIDFNNLGTTTVEIPEYTMKQ